MRIAAARRGTHLDVFKQISIDGIPERFGR